MSFSLLDHTAQPAADDLQRSCASALTQRVQRSSVLPELRVDPLTPLPLADAAGGVVRFVYFILASRPFGHETINRNVQVLQRPGALEDKGSNDTNLFLVHVDAKLGEVRPAPARATAASALHAVGARDRHGSTSYGTCSSSRVPTST